MNKWAIGIVIFVLVVAAAIYGLYEKNDYDFDDAKKSYEVVKKWELPLELVEISGMRWMGDDRIACVQDEDGIIFIYDLNAGKIVEKHKFSGGGDYEAMAVLNNEYWIAESNGTLFNIKELTSGDEDLEGFQLDFKYRNNIEGLTANSDGNLWLAVKDRNLDNSGDYKGIYSFNPNSQVLDHEPVLKIKYDDPKFDVLKTNNPRKLIRPSDLAFNPLTNDLFVLDAEFQKVLVVNKTGKIKELHLLDPEEFAQPEGICFTPSGRIFISSEGVGGPAIIAEIRFN
ncbi:MAG: SdiA-regulated domain-containing protein [Christiangramia sp.]